MTAESAASGTKNELREIALRLFLQKGFAATSVREVATQAGVTIPALYYHFANKDGLLGDLVEELISDGDKAIDSIAAHPLDAAYALGVYYDVIAKHVSVFQLVMADPSVRFHPAAGDRLAQQGTTFLRLLVGDDADHNDTVRAHCALGAIRRPLRARSTDLDDDRAQILRSALAAFSAT